MIVHIHHRRKPRSRAQGFGTEGVETAAIMTALTRLDCDIVQGYHISRALPAADPTAFLASSGWSVARTTLAAAEA